MKIKTPTRLKTPCFLMNFPFTVDNKVHNNPIMDQYSEPYNYDIAFEQFMNLYKLASSEALIYLLPSEGDYQDQTYVANLGCYLPNIQDNDIILLANFKSPPRIGEEIIGRKFFYDMNYEVHQPPFHWEGEADLKYIRKNVYVGGYGIRTDFESHKWMMDNFDMNIVSIEMDDQELYHLDCILFPIDNVNSLVIVDALRPKDLKQLEHYTNIIEVPKHFKYDCWTNSVRIGKKVFSFLVGDSDSEDSFRKLIEKHNLEVVNVNLKEFDKSGAALSCMMMHLNYPDQG